MPSHYQLKHELKPKVTKLERFLAKIDLPTLSLMKKYIHDNDRLDENIKYDRVRLVHDLCIIVKFKQNENAIVNKKIIDDIVKQFSEEFGFSTTTIRQRIQKKLSDVSMADLLDHIKLGVDFTFDVRRRLMPVRGVGVDRFVKNDRYSNRFNFYDSRKLEKQEVKSENRKIEYQETYPKIQNIPPKDSRTITSPQQTDADLYNQFRQDQEEFSHEIILVRQELNNYKITSVKAEINDQIVFDNIVKGKLDGDIIEQKEQIIEVEVKTENVEKPSENGLDLNRQKESKELSEERTFNSKQNDEVGQTSISLPQIEKNPMETSQQNELQLSNISVPEPQQQINH